MTSIPLERHDPAAAGRWFWAIFGALIWHLFVLLGLAFLQPFAPGDSDPSPPAPVDLVFEPLQPVAETPSPRPEADEPKTFTELPVDRADVAPDEPDFLSNVDSRARDRATGEVETELPRGEGESESPSVALDPRAPGETETSVDPSAGADPQPEAESLEQDEGPRDAGLLDEGRAVDASQTAPEAGGGDSPGALARTGNPEAEILRRPSATRLEAPRYRIDLGGQGIFQEELRNPTGNVSLFGDISLNTLAWDWAPWIQRFTRDFHRNWIAPYAYLIGVIHGKELVDLEVAKDGRILRLEVIEEEGHPSLTESTLATFRAFAPYQPLPAHFPEETLRMRITVIYPDRRR